MAIRSFIFLINSFFLLLLLGHCGKPQPQAANLIGSWKTDSAYYFYNGFHQTQTGNGSDWSIHTYNQEGKVFEEKFGTSRSHWYELKGDTLHWNNPAEGSNEHYQVLHLSRNRLVLKKAKPPLFPGDNQERYEVRYFSKKK